MQSVFFLMFLFAIGFRTGPEFVQGLRANAVPQIMVTVVLVATALAVAWGAARVLALDGGTTAGLLAGSQTNSTALGTATHAVGTLRLDPARAEQLSNNVATVYALTYFLGTLLLMWFLPIVGPRLMGVDLRAACRQLEEQMGRSSDAAEASTYSALVVRAYRVPDALAGRTVAEIEARWPRDRRAGIPRVRQAGALLDADAATVLHAGAVVAVVGRPAAMLADANPFAEEVDDRELLDMPAGEAEILLTNPRWAGRALGELGHELGTVGIALLNLRRAGRELPFTRETVVERGDVLRVRGLQSEIRRVAAEVGVAEHPTSITDVLLVAATVAVGGLLGLPTFRTGQLEIGLSAPVGVLLAGLVVGYLASIRPRLGRLPEASRWLLETLGLTAFLALVGLAAGPGLVAAVRASGPALVVAGVLVTLVPHAVAILFGRYVIGMHPGMLLGVCSGAGTSAPALAEVEKAAQSKIPSLGYGVACALGNVLLAVSGTVLVLVGNR